MITEKIREGIYRVKIPFDNIYTTSFIMADNGSAIIFDCGTTDDDALDYIIPAVDELGVTVEYIVISHMHEDHCGGLDALKRAYPDAVVGMFSQEVEQAHHFYDGEILLERFKMLNLKGHSEDCLAILDLKTSMLFTGDCLQLYGVGRYRTAIADKDEYYKSIDKVRALKLHTIVASHEYEPLGSIAEGEKINEYLDVCINAAKQVK